MRIITGQAKGIKLCSPKGYDVRPTADRVKESIFNIIGNKVRDATVLDLFAGTGNLGLEAISRGANQSVFVDNSLNSIRLIQKNIELTRFADYSMILKLDSISALRKLQQLGWSFDLIFCDPPYNKGYATKIILELSKLDLLKEKGWLLLEHSKHEELSKVYDEFTILRIQEYGETRFTIIEKI